MNRARADNETMTTDLEKGTTVNLVPEGRRNEPVFHLDPVARAHSAALRAEMAGGTEHVADLMRDRTAAAALADPVRGTCQHHASWTLPGTTTCHMCKVTGHAGTRPMIEALAADPVAR